MEVERGRVKNQSEETKMELSVSPNLFTLVTLYHLYFWDKTCFNIVILSSPPLPCAQQTTTLSIDIFEFSSFCFDSFYFLFLFLNLKDTENVHFMYYLDYLRVHAFNFHMKDFGDKQEDKDTKGGKTGGGDRGNQTWKKEKKQKIDENNEQRVESNVEKNEDSASAIENV